MEPGRHNDGGEGFLAAKFAPATNHETEAGKR